MRAHSFRVFFSLKSNKLMFYADFFSNSIIIIRPIYFFSREKTESTAVMIKMKTMIGIIRSA